jgi:hypothetical protein
MDGKKAGEDVRRGEKHLAEARYWDAIQMFEPALDYVDGPPSNGPCWGSGARCLRNPTG